MYKHKITQDGQHIYTINTWREQKQKDGQHIYTINIWREQTQNNSTRETHIHNQYLVHA
jgi:hypothetical protein